MQRTSCVVCGNGGGWVMKWVSDRSKADVRQFWSQNPMIYGRSVDESLDDEAFLRMCTATDRLLYHRLSGRVHDPGEPMYGRIIDYGNLVGARVLEVGCGLGTLLWEFSRQGLEVHGLDLSDTHVAHCERRVLLGDIRARVMQGDAEHLPYDSESFDLVVSHGVLHHTPRTDLCIQEIQRVLKPKGQMVTMLYHRYSYRVLYVYYMTRMPHRFRHPAKRVFCTLQDCLNWSTDIHDPDQLGSPLAYAFTKREVDFLCSQFSSVSHLTWDYPELISRFPLGMFVPLALRKAFLARWGYFLVTNAFK